MQCANLDSECDELSESNPGSFGRSDIGVLTDDAEGEPIAEEKDDAGNEFDNFDAENFDAIIEKISGVGDKGIGTKEIWRAIRKLSSKNVRSVTSKLYYKRGMTSGELREATHLSVSELNHVLIDMKTSGMIVVEGEKKGKQKYFLTRYYMALLSALRVLMMNLDCIEKEDVFSAHRLQKNKKR